MHLILCIDERDGLSFCGKRQSRDRAVNEHILQMADGQKVWMSPYSAPFFEGNAVCADAHFLEKAGVGEYCFLEVDPLPENNENLESVILYHWNRTYPSTVKFPRSLLSGMNLVQREEFSGSSHETITMERYTL